MSAILAWLIGPLGRWVALAVLLALLYASIVVQQRRIGEDRATARIERANGAARDKADAAERDVLDCRPPRQWIRGEGCRP